MPLTRSLATTKIAAAIYARYSSDRQRDASIEDQIRLCKELIARMGWVVGPIYIDRQVSGSVVSRQGFQELRRDIRRGLFQVVVAESPDRLMRDTEASANFSKQCRFAGVAIHTCTYGPGNKLIMGVKAVMDEVFLDDLADKTRRGLRGRIEAGASAGGLSYGYDVVVTAEGEDKGERRINDREAEVVRRIFDDYGLRNLSPKKIAAALNSEKTPGPRGGDWSQSTINGNRARGTGILHNELYVGVLVWNRLRYVKDPDTGKRVSQPNPENQWVRKAVPNLRCVSDVSWGTVRARLAALDMAAKPASDGSTFQSKQRPKSLLAQLLECGACGGGYSKISATHVGCSNARNKGEAVCANRRTVKLAQLEDNVLTMLRERMMAPEVYAAFVRGFTAEWNAEQKGRAVAQEGQRDELRRLARKIANFVDTIGEGNGSAALLSALKDAEARKSALEAELAVAEAPAPRLLPNLAELYRAKVADLQEALGGESAAAARDRLRALIDAVVLIPSPSDRKAVPTIEVRGALASMLALGSGKDASAACAAREAIEVGCGGRI